MRLAGGGGGWQCSSLTFAGGVMGDVTISIDLLGVESFAFAAEVTESDSTSALTLKGWNGTTQRRQRSRHLHPDH